ncbi:MAG: nuclear transport factor 2 family protein [Parvibaculum sp.]|uniref:nuclear transport factor 2 family protein n=1 Tax=Parvibaculum sp. TaxID=2024848 RepID=UPI002600BD96|nr:nuclear transport factor 2 family protein [Parvibaculum sp.]MCE9650357.1 nuclear transport factor 2 family protein [Parvibaculum sp.]
MPSQETVRKFVDVVVSGRHDEAIELFYAEDASMQENLGELRRGRDGLVERERQVMGMFKEIRTTCVEPFFIEGDRVAINWIFEFVQADGKTSKINEVAIQEWRGDKIVRERFYYDPGQMAA